MSMLRLEWNSMLSVKNAKLDNEHKELIDSINRLLTDIAESEAMEVLHSDMLRIEEHVSRHFKEEEKMMADSFYPAELNHKLEHDALLYELKSRKHGLEVQGENCAECVEVYRWLTDWLTTHILETDSKFGTYLNEHQR